VTVSGLCLCCLMAKSLCINHTCQLCPPLRKTSVPQWLMPLEISRFVSWQLCCFVIQYDNLLYRIVIRNYISLSFQNSSVVLFVFQDSHNQKDTVTICQVRKFTLVAYITVVLIVSTSSFCVYHSNCCTLCFVFCWFKIRTLFMFIGAQQLRQ